jgi:hypothetical protein
MKNLNNILLGIRAYNYLKGKKKFQRLACNLSIIILGCDKQHGNYYPKQQNKERISKRQKKNKGIKAKNLNKIEIKDFTISRIT